MATNRIGFLDLLILLLSFYVFGALLIEFFVKLEPEMSRLLMMIDTLICFVFFIDFLRLFIRAENKWHFMKWGWIDLIACIPSIDILRAGRILRLVRIFRIIKAFRTLNQFYNVWFANRARGTFSTVGIMAVLLLVFSSIAILQVESGLNSNIKTAEDALWWSFVTITTVGYGDFYPTTTEGRLIASVLMLGGVSLFGTLSGFLSSWFLGDRKLNATNEES
ncbi:ion transporter [Cytophagales bacterium LB-30]|uniref:Ion transporter n=1 Tax=Shiella aurantiaca TaxID=3058365 RepID=A0ABT8F447_9BACT|nr:ion transporter [Shiella aurantiaca]MDN4165232.1 ion transporter [Shiella aurantiaca]